MGSFNAHLSQSIFRDSDAPEDDLDLLEKGRDFLQDDSRNPLPLRGTYAQHDKETLAKNLQKLSEDLERATRKVNIVAKFSHSGNSLIPEFHNVSAVHLQPMLWQREKEIHQRRVQLRRKGAIDFRYTISSSFRENFCGKPEIWSREHYLKSFQNECISLGEDVLPTTQMAKDLVTDWHRKDRSVSYMDRSAMYVDFCNGGKTNPMHLIHNNLFPIVFHHLMCYNGDEDIVGVLPTEVKKNEWMNLYVRRVFEMLFGNSNVVGFEESPSMMCFKKVTYLRGKYIQVDFNAFLGLVCPFTLEDPVMQEECDNLATNAVKFMSQVLASFVEEESPPWEQWERPLNIFVYDRMEQSSRRWKNANESIEELRKLNDVRVELIPSFQIPLSEQCRLFREADIFIMPHGGALANSLCGRKFTGIVEIMKKCYTYDEFWLHSITDTLKLAHVFAECTTSNKAQEEFEVAPEVILEATESIIEDVRIALELRGA
eukprot:CAMPEP_0198736668 /NCGR_PEP_ID=MMETSP1475-20131203/67406_1 /TAXON_ID= ORGANISM="Unidentified sp., Strain CCMP1999" /NCGR_SAMPLE_ID=MMETSP1475 /ASSEMBLY_ACC=CAM_ASM_001111 /LENGTH=485 /DNA_ID=CAMNT_0044500517 /DNA_START=263 /DNA_END=1720 /DNA_ORIENTATION=+